MENLVTKLANLGTEQRNQNTKDIDILPTRDVLEIINKEDATVASNIASKMDDIVKLTDAYVDTIKNGGRIFQVGCGTSGRLALVDAAELPCTYGIPYGQVIGVMGGGLEAVVRPAEGLEDHAELGEEDVKKLGINSKDMVIGVAASGRTPYVIGAMKYAQSLGCKVGSISSAAKSEFSEFADYPVDIPTGPEIVLGSTRMKGGTTTKLVLNMVSSTAMIKLGHVFSNYLIDGYDTNEKGWARSVRQIMEMTGCSEQEAHDAYYEVRGTEHDFKVACTMCFTKLSADKAREALAKHDGNLKLVLKELDIKY
ncbi:MAG: N-acetylmuramic acid 6-phosphate etherase [Erysipelotrichaceae bacterium]|nr:N-acetylmuramic acid 6-phosphate etherase [Erysipelotrichaceae bacterium]